MSNTTLVGKWRVKCQNCGNVDTVRAGTEQHKCEKCGKQTKDNEKGFLVVCSKSGCPGEYVSGFLVFSHQCQANHTVSRSAPLSGSMHHPLPSQSGCQIPFPELKIGTKIGEGAFARVMKAEWRGEECAVKQFKFDNSYTEDNVLASLKNEASMLQSLNHECIVRLKGITTAPESGDMPSLVMEYMKDGSLDALIRKDAPLQRAVIIRILLDVAEGLIYLHSHSIIHRDIKSGNILLHNDRTRAKVSDFGTAKIYDHISGNKPTTGVGTIGFMAPEVLKGNAYDERADDRWLY